MPDIPLSRTASADVPWLPISPTCRGTKTDQIHLVMWSCLALPSVLGDCDRNKKSGSCEHLIVGTQTRLAEHYDGTRHHSGRRVATAYLI